MNELTETVHPLTKAEVSELNRSFRWTLLISLVMISLLLGVTYFSTSAGFSGISIAIAVFDVFFIAVLGFILRTKYTSAKGKQKTVIVGRVSIKRTETSRGRNSNLNEFYYVVVGTRSFNLQLNQFNIARRGHLVELHVVAGHVFKVVDLGNPTPLNKHFSSFETTSFEASMTHEDKQVVYAKLKRLALNRVLIGGIGFYILYWIVMVFSVILLSVSDSKFSQFVVVIYGVRIALIGIYGWINLKTIRVLLDYFKGEKEVVFERVVDAIESNYSKTTVNSIVSRSISEDWDQKYYYLQSQHHWLPVDEAIYAAVGSDEAIEIEMAKYSRLVLRIKKVGK